MENTLINLKENKVLLENELSILKNESYLYKLKVSSIMREMLINKFPKILEVLVDNDIKISIKKNDSNTKYIVINNTSMYLRSSSYTDSYSPTISYDYLPIDKNSTYTLDYINLLQYLTVEILKDNSEFFTFVIQSMYEVYSKKSKIYNTTVKLEGITVEIRDIEYKIKSELFFSTLKNGNFYYKIKKNYGRISYLIYYIDKINPKTVTISKIYTIGEGKDFDNLEKGYGDSKRIRTEILYDTFIGFTLVSKEDFIEIVKNNKFKYAIDEISKSKGLKFLRDIKGLCKVLKEKGVTNTNVPDNDTLSVISKWIYYTLEKRI